jgi:hypothetical protein
VAAYQTKYGLMMPPVAYTPKVTKMMSFAIHSQFRKRRLTPRR